MICYLLLSVVIIIAAALIRSLTKQLERISEFSKPNQLHFNLGRLLQNGYHGAYFILEHDKTKRFIQVKKYVENSAYGIELAMPRAEWSKDFFDDVVAMADQYGFPITYQDDSKASLEFAYIDFGQNVDVATKFCRSVITQIFSVVETDVFSAGQVGIDSNINFPTLQNHPSNYEISDRHSL